jgi:hypothetical protein
MFRKERVYHPDLQKEKEERPPVDPLWDDAVKDVKISWMEQKMSRRSLITKVVAGIEVGIAAFSVEETVNGTMITPSSYDVFPDGENHSPYQITRKQEVGNAKQLPTPVLNPTPQKQK